MRNLEIARIGATEINEFEYQRHQGEMTEQDRGGQQGADGKRLTQAERVAQITAAAHKKVEKKRKKEGAKSETKKAARSAKSAKASSTKNAKPAAASKGGKAKKKK